MTCRCYQPNSLTENTCTSIFIIFLLSICFRYRCWHAHVTYQHDFVYSYLFKIKILPYRTANLRIYWHVHHYLYNLLAGQEHSILGPLGSQHRKLRRLLCSLHTHPTPHSTPVRVSSEPLCRLTHVPSSKYFVASLTLHPTSTRPLHIQHLSMRLYMGIAMKQSTVRSDVKLSDLARCEWTQPRIRSGA